jgi:hypothetical protein
MLYREFWKTALRWTALFLLFFFVQYQIIKKMVYYRLHNAAENVAIPRVESPQIVPIWHSESDSVHLLLYPYFFAHQQQKFHNQILNQGFIPAAQLAYYRLWLINFNASPVAFVDTRHRLQLVCKDGSRYENVPLSLLLPQVRPALRPFLQVLCQQEPIPAGHMKEYLVAFTEAVPPERIQTMQISWDNKPCPLVYNLSLRRYLDGYLQHPTRDFWRQIQPQPTAENR